MREGMANVILRVRPIGTFLKDICLNAGTKMPTMPH